MDKNSKFQNALIKYIEILPVAIAIIDEDFSILDYNAVFEQTHLMKQEQLHKYPDKIKRLWENPSTINATISDYDGKEYKLLILPDETIHINSLDDFMMLIKLYLDSLKWTVSLNVEGLKFAEKMKQILKQLKDQTESIKTKSISEVNQKVIVAVRNFVERNMIENFLRKLLYKPILRWGNEDIGDLLSMIDNVSFVVVNEKMLTQIGSINIPIIVLTDFGKKFSIKQKYPNVNILERPISFENFRMLVDKIKS